MDTVGRNKKAIETYIRTQLQEDIVADQISLKEYMDPFTGEPVPKKQTTRLAGGHDFFVDFLYCRGVFFT